MKITVVGMVLLIAGLVSAVLIIQILSQQAAQKTDGTEGNSQQTGDAPTPPPSE